MDIDVRPILLVIVILEIQIFEKGQCSIWSNGPLIKTSIHSLSSLKKVILKKKKHTEQNRTEQNISLLT